MITSKHVRDEMKNTKTVVESDAKVDAKLKAIYKLVEVAVKVGLDTRGNTVKTMEKLGVALVKPRRPKDNAEEKPETTKE